MKNKNIGICPDHPTAELKCVVEQGVVFDSYVFRKSKVLKLRYFCSVCNREITETPGVITK